MGGSLLRSISESVLRPSAPGGSIAACGGKRHWLLSDDRAPPHLSCFSCSAPGAEHFPNVHAAAKADIVVAAFKITLPSPESRVVPEVAIGGQRLGEFRVVAAVRASVLHHRGVTRS